METTITEKTLLPLGVVSILFAGIFWLSSLYSVAASTESRVTKIENRHDQVIEDIHIIKENLAVIKEMLKKSR